MPAHASRSPAPAPSVPPSRACSLRHRPANAGTPAKLSGSPASRPVKLRSVDSGLARLIPSRIAIEVSGAVVALLAVIIVLAAVDSGPGAGYAIALSGPGAGSAIALATYFVVAGAGAAVLAITQRDPTVRLVAASAGAGLTFVPALAVIYSVGAALLPALLLWLLAVAELSRDASDRAAAIAAGVGFGSAAAAIGLLVATR